jgi:hypothetical protein
VESQFIESAYEPFVAALRDGHFVAPTEGWSAAEVAAHVALNNDLIATVAESIVAGDQPSYDNSAATDIEQLRAYAARFGGLASLATAVEQSARRLAAAAQALDEISWTRELRVRIVDNGDVVRDGPLAIGEFIKGNASFHLNIHLEQLISLQS